MYLPLTAAFLTGLFGSVHCMGMCGPICLALPLKDRSNWEEFAGILVYNFGRIFTYALLGLIIGNFGGALAWAITGKWLSFIAGIGFLIFVIYTYFIGQNIRAGFVNNPVGNLIRKPLGQLFRHKSFAALSGIGMLNGLLPCGLVYAALAGSFATASAINGSVYMVFFGLGTLPGMIASFYSATFLKTKLYFLKKTVVPVFLLCLGVLLIYRSGVFQPNQHTENSAVTTCK